MTRILGWLALGRPGSTCCGPARQALGPGPVKLENADLGKMPRPTQEGVVPFLRKLSSLGGSFE